jgi:hypothetical protein
MFMVLASSHYQIQSKITPKDMFVKGELALLILDLGFRTADLNKDYVLF